MVEYDLVIWVTEVKSFLPQGKRVSTALLFLILVSGAAFPNYPIHLL